LERVETHQLPELQEIRHASRDLERLVELLPGTRHGHALPELVAQSRDLAKPFFEPVAVPFHAAELPHDLPELAVERGHRALAPDREEAPGARGDGLLRGNDLRAVARDRSELSPREIVPDRVRNDEVAVGE